MSSEEDWEQEVIEAQLELNRDSWFELQQHGVTEETELRLEFFYVAPDERAARALAEALLEDTEYEVGVESSGGGMLKRKDWAVNGTTHPTVVSQEILDEWVAWMVMVGLENGCDFEGWGAQLA
jgi:hypothetical protein